MNHKESFMKSALVVAALLLAGCASTTHDKPAAAATPKATAKLDPTKGNTANGAVTFTQQGDKVRMTGSVSGLKPGQQHGFHLHEKGDCSSGDGLSAGGHFNPQGKPHGAPSGSEHHAGDFPALRADSYGNASIDALVDAITVTDGPNSVVGKGLIVHRDADDYQTQPTGNSGPRIACGVVHKD